LKTLFTYHSWYYSGIETLVIGGAAAIISYVLGAVLENI
jgi:VIT1/CCC1 family predicted Fe2+/Mn2+ transporter